MNEYTMTDEKLQQFHEFIRKAADPQLVVLWSGKDNPVFKDSQLVDCPEDKSKKICEPVNLTKEEAMFLIFNDYMIRNYVPWLRPWEESDTHGYYCWDMRFSIWRPGTPKKKHSDNGDLMTIEEFTDLVKSGAIINWDGMGWYADDTYEYGSYEVDCDQFKHGPEWHHGKFTHVKWYNR